MATKKSTPGTRSRRNPQSAVPPARIQFEALRDHIEAQRFRLMDAEALLDCAIVAMEEDERLRVPGPNYPNVVRIVRELVHTTINHLDSIHVKAAIERATVLPSGSAETPANGVKEEPAAYLH